MLGHGADRLEAFLAARTGVYWRHGGSAGRRNLAVVAALRRRRPRLFDGLGAWSTTPRRCSRCARSPKAATLGAPLSPRPAPAAGLPRPSLAAWGRGNPPTGLIAVSQRECALLRRPPGVRDGPRPHPTAMAVRRRRAPGHGTGVACCSSARPRSRHAERGTGWCGFVREVPATLARPHRPVDRRRTVARGARRRTGHRRAVQLARPRRRPASATTTPRRVFRRAPARLSPPGVAAKVIEAACPRRAGSSRRPLLTLAARLVVRTRAARQGRAETPPGFAAAIRRPRWRRTTRGG